MTHRTFRISDEFDTNMKCEIRIDTSEITEEVAHEINGFWSGADYRLDMADGDVYVAVAKLAGGTCLRLALSDDWIADAPRLLTRALLNEEGWPPAGIEVTEIEGVPRIDEAGLEVEEIRE